MSGRWYIVNVHSGSEHRVKSFLEEQIEKKGFQDRVHEILVPTSEVTEVKQGKKVTSEKKYFPGYILVNMEMSDETWHLVTSSPKVSSFLGARKRPAPLTKKEAEKIIGSLREGTIQTKSTMSFDIGEEVNVCDGPFQSFSGIVEEVDEAKSKLKVTVSIFGRSTPVDLDFTQVEKVS